MSEEKRTEELSVCHDDKELPAACPCALPSFAVAARRSGVCVMSAGMMAGI
jgi:hypothetical protein